MWVGVWDAAFVFLRSTRFIGEVEIWSGAGACHMSVFKVSTYVQKILWVCLERRMFCLLLLKIDFRRNVALRQSRRKTWKGAWSVWNSKERGYCIYSKDAAIDTIHYHALSAVLVMLKCSSLPGQRITYEKERQSWQNDRLEDQGWRACVCLANVDTLTTYCNCSPFVRVIDQRLVRCMVVLYYSNKDVVATI